MSLCTMNMYKTNKSIASDGKKTFLSCPWLYICFHSDSHRITELHFDSLLDVIRVYNLIALAVFVQDDVNADSAYYQTLSLCAPDHYIT